MSIVTKTFKTHFTTHWQWPLTIGLASQSVKFKNKLFNNEWPKVFSTIDTLKKGLKFKHYNIVIAEDYNESISFFNDTITADVLIIIKDNNSFLKQSFSVDFFSLKGIFFISLGTSDVSTWFNNLIISLSHNENIIDSLKNTTDDGLFIYDLKLKVETTLSYVIKVIVKLLRKQIIPKPTFKVKTRLTDKTNFTANNLAKFLELNAKQFVYVSESGAASDLNEITKPVFDKLGKYLFITPKMQYDESLPTMKINNSRLKRNKVAPVKLKKSAAKNVTGIGGIGKTTGSKPYVGHGGIWKKVGVKKAIGYSRRLKKATVKKATKPLKNINKVKSNNLRFLQANIKTNNNKNVKSYLKPSTKYIIEIRIGFEDKLFTNAPKDIKVAPIFKKSRTLVETIQVIFKSNQDKNVYSGKIKLPKKGNSTSAHFEFSTQNKLKSFKGDVYAFHKNRLIQQVQLTASIKLNSTPASKKIEMNVVLSPKTKLDDLGYRTNFTASLIHIENKSKAGSLDGISGGKAVDLYFSSGLKTHLLEIKQAIEDALIDIKKHPARLTAKGNQELLLFLAMKGSLIYTNHIRGEIASDGPLQIITNYQEYSPIDFIYSLPAPDLKATLCNKAEKALLDGKCHDCFNKETNPSPHVCPFGFWALNRIIERHSYKKRRNTTNSDYSLLSEPTTIRNTLHILQNTIYGSSQKVEKSKSGLRKAIAAEIKRNTKTLYEVDNWNNWTSKMSEHHPESIILVVHIEKDAKLKIDKIEIGDNDFMIQTHFGSKVLLNTGKTEPPFIIIIGCESTNLATSGFDVSSQFINEGAAIVLSNFTKIRGRQAKDIIVKLVQFLKFHDNKEILFGEVLLKLRQNLLSNGLMAGLSLVAQGDADWKIKT